MPRSLHPLGVTAAAATLAACTPISGARPLEPGMHEVGATLGGPIVRVSGAPIPLPNLLAQGRSGIAKPLDRPLDLNYGLNVTAMPFGILQGHFGADYLLSEQDGAVPAMSSTSRFYFGANVLAAPAKPQIQGWGNYQLEFNLSWLVKQQLIYFGLSQYTDFGNPRVTITPALGAVFDPTPKTATGSKLHLELRWFAPGLSKNLDAVDWVPNNPGAIGLMLGYSYVLREKKR